MNGDSYEGGCLGTRGARIWVFLGFVMGFAAVIASCSILFTVYINEGNKIYYMLFICVTPYYFSTEVSRSFIIFTKCSDLHCINYF